MQNNDLIGKVVRSKAGRDTNHLYVVIGQLDNEYVLIVNGKTKTLEKPKKKKIKHLDFLKTVDDEFKTAIDLKSKSTDLEIKRFLKFEGIVKEG